MVAGLLVAWAADEPKKTSGERRVSRLNIFPAGLLFGMKTLCENDNDYF